MPRPMFLLTVCCFVLILRAAPSYGCKCIRTTSKSIPLSVIRRIEMLPISGKCRWTEMIITMKNNFKVCVDPSAKWLNPLIQKLQRRNYPTTASAPSASASASASTLDR